LLSDIRVIPESIQALRAKMSEAAKELGLPPLCG
jgi:hypothetical protein